MPSLFPPLLFNNFFACLSNYYLLSSSSLISRAFSALSSSRLTSPRSPRKKGFKLNQAHDQGKCIFWILFGHRKILLISEQPSGPSGLCVLGSLL
ncbi:hypothetical protein K1719_003159 [Acacia pycnantha]|nr:hypothetical protein K1719_003159 [Acacia pycnantha]